jgi:hypothetical protein
MIFEIQNYGLFFISQNIFLKYPILIVLLPNVSLFQPRTRNGDTQFVTILSAAATRRQNAGRFGKIA